MNLFTHALFVLAQHREFRAAQSMLNRYSDRQLRDMGLAGADLTRVAYDEAKRRVATPRTDVTRSAAGIWQDAALA